MSEMPEKTISQAAQPGDVYIERVDLTRAIDNFTIDLRPFVIEINVYEDIFSPSLYGNLVIRDAANLIGRMPIVGDETIHLSISTPLDGSPSSYTPDVDDPVNKIQKSFAVYAIKNRILEEHKEQIYVIHFCSQEAIVDNITKICKKFEGTTDEIAKEIWEEYFSNRDSGAGIISRYYTIQNSQNGTGGTITPTEATPFVISGTPHESRLSFLPGMWSPFECINWLAKRTIGKNSGLTSNYLFYETTKGFYYASLHDLIKTQLEEDNVFCDFIYTQKRPRNELRSFEKGYSHIEELKFKTNMDMIQSQNLGHLASSLHMFDIVNKEYRLFYYDHVFGFRDGVHMESFKSDGSAVTLKDKTTSDYTNMMFPPTIYRSSETRPITATIHGGVLDSENEDDIDLRPNAFVSQRLSALMDIATTKMEITVPGRTDAEVGRLVRLYFPNIGNVSQTETDPDLWDPLVSGIYMMTAIHHHITKFRHTMTVEISKDSYANPIYDMVIPEEVPASREIETSYSSGGGTNGSNNTGTSGDGTGTNTGTSGDGTGTNSGATDPGGPNSSGPVNREGWTHPLAGQGRVSSVWNDPNRRVHKGVDIAAPNGTPIYAAHSGTVIVAGSVGKYGNVVYIDHGDGIQTRYGHMISAPSVRVGERVTAGQRIGSVGSTGRSTGPHLHFEVRRGTSSSAANGSTRDVDPMPFIS